MKQLSNADIAAKVRKAMKDEASAINYLADFFDGDQIAEVAKTIANCQGRIFTSACGRFPHPSFHLPTPSMAALAVSRRGIL